MLHSVGPGAPDKYKRKGGNIKIYKNTKIQLDKMLHSVRPSALDSYKRKGKIQKQKLKKYKNTKKLNLPLSSSSCIDLL